MKKILFSILSAFIVSTMASAQYLNVKLDDGTYRSYKTSSKTEVSFGDKKGTDPTVSTQSVNVNGHKVTVKLADDILASDVALNVSVEDNTVKIEAISMTNKELICTWDNKVSYPDPIDRFYTFIISDISKDVVATVKYKPIYTVKFDMKGHGEAIQDAKVLWNQKATAPSTPTAANYAFWRWCTDAECTTPYDFSKVVTADMTLYAKWTDGINGHAYVELAGKKWATENVGACSTIPVAGPGTPGNDRGLYYYNQEVASGTAQNWGSETDASQVTHSWKLPSEDQWQALIEECYWEWTGSYNYPTSPYNGMSGYIVYFAKSDDDKHVRNKGNSGYTPTADTHLFLPNAGVYLFDYWGVPTERKEGCHYWLADGGKCFVFEKFTIGTDYYDSNCGMSVRPVSE